MPRPAPIVHEFEQYSPQYWAARLGVPTASKASLCLTPTTRKRSKSLEPYASLLAWQLHLGDPTEPFRGSRATERGHRLEPEACDAYAYLADEPALKKVGFVTDAKRRIGCSPDRLIGVRGGLEVKCPELAEYIRVLMYHEEHGSVPPEYLAQVHWTLIVTERVWWDIIFYHPEQPEEPVIARVLRDPEWERPLRRVMLECVRHRNYALRVLQSRAGRFGPALEELRALGEDTHDGPAWQRLVDEGLAPVIGDARVSALDCREGVPA